MNEKEVKLNQAAVDIITNNTLSEMLPREQQAYALMVALELAKSEAARQYHSPSKQEGTEETFTLKELRAFAVDFAYYLTTTNQAHYSHEMHKEIFNDWITPKITKTQNP